MDTEAYRKKVELEILEIMEERLKHHKMDAKRAREIAQYILDSLHPHMSLNQIYDVVQDFDKHFAELIPVVLDVSRSHSEKIKSLVLTHASGLIKQGKISQANSLLKKATSKEIKLKEE